MGVSVISFPLGMLGSSRKEMVILFLIYSEHTIVTEKSYFPKLSSPLPSLICEARVLHVIQKSQSYTQFFRSKETRSACDRLTRVFLLVYGQAVFARQRTPGYGVDFIIVTSKPVNDFSFLTDVDDHHYTILVAEK